MDWELSSEFSFMRFTGKSSLCVKEAFVMSKSGNLPMTTREPISDAKARVFITKLELGLPPLQMQQAKERSPELWVTLLI